MTFEVEADALERLLVRESHDIIDDGFIQINWPPFALPVALWETLISRLQ